MPMPNFHVVHLKPFDEFDPATVRTEYGGLVFGVQMPEDVWVRYAFHKERKEELPFSVGFPADKYTLDEITAFMNEAGIPYIEIIPASNQEALRGVRLLSVRISKVGTQDRFAKMRGGGRVRKLAFSGLARTSEPVVGCDGVLEYDDITTLRINSLTLPLDYAHNFDVVVGRVTSIRKRGGNLYIRGEVISARPGDQADEIIDSLLAGRPHQLSIFAVADGKSVVREITEPDGIHETPCRVYENYVLRGVAICTYGADGNTKVVPKNLIEEGVGGVMSSTQPDPDPTARMLSESEQAKSRQPEGAPAGDQPPAEDPTVDQPDVMEEIATLKEQLRSFDERLAAVEEKQAAFTAQLEGIITTLNQVVEQLNATSAEIEAVREETKRAHLPSFTPADVSKPKSARERTLEYFKSVVQKWWS